MDKSSDRWPKPRLSTVQNTARFTMIDIGTLLAYIFVVLGLFLLHRQARLLHSASELLG